MKHGRLKPVWRPNGPLPGDQVWEGEMAADTLTKDQSLELMQAEIERLRDELATYRLGKHHAENTELKAEIERLRDDRDSWAQQADDRVKDCEGFIAEIERLRGLLREAIQNPDIYGDEPATYDWIKRVREALGEK